MNRRERQAAILRLVQERALSTQVELAQALRDEGHDVVQTTVSRDVTEIGLVKVRAPSGRLIYAAPGTGDADRLRGVAADAYFPIAHPACAPLERKTIEHVRAGLIASGRATAAEIDQHLGNLDAGRLDLAIGPMISAWGRKPA